MMCHIRNTSPGRSDTGANPTNQDHCRVARDTSAGAKRKSRAVDATKVEELIMAARRLKAIRKIKKLLGDPCLDTSKQRDARSGLYDLAALAEKRLFELATEAGAAARAELYPRAPN